MKELQFSPFTANVFEKYSPVGKNLPAIKGDPAAVPGRQTKFLSPRFEPSNITQNATVAEIQNAIREAENGEPRDLFRFYRDVLLSDNHIQSEINTRKLAMLAQPLAIMPADKNNPDDVKLAAALLRAKNDCENWNAGLIALMDSNAGWPVSIIERLYGPAGEPRGDEPRLNFTLKKLAPVNPMLLSYRWAYLMGGTGLGTSSAIQQVNMNGGQAATGNAYTIDLERWEPYIKLWPIDDGGRIIYDTQRAEYLDPARHIVHRGHLLTSQRDNWGGPMRAILMWWLLRNLGRDWFARGMDRYASPFPVAYTDINDPAQVNLLREAFALANKIGGLVVSEDSRIELKEAMVQGMAQGYEIFHKMCNDEISKHITGLDRSSKPAGLNAGANQMQQSVREDYRVFDQMSLNETLVKQLAIPFRDVNGLKGMVNFVWGGLSDADAQTFSTLLLNMKQAGYQLTDESIPTANERTGLSWERAAAPAPNDFGNPPPKTFSVGGIKLLASIKAPREPDAVEALITARKEKLAATYKGVMAPFRQAIEDSTSRADLERRLKTLYADWSPDRLKTEIESALQLAAAAGAVQAKPK